jgi:subtilisin family serine protease
VERIPHPRRRALGLRRSIGVVAAALAATMAVAAPAAAAEKPTNWWWDTYDVSAAHDAGWTGAGVKIAVIDDAINPDLPAFAGRNLTVAPGALCTEYDSAATSEPTSGSVHGSTLTALIIGTGQGSGAIRGIAPDADVTFYGWGRAQDDQPCTTAGDGALSAFGAGLRRAIDDGAQIVTTSVGAPRPALGEDAEVIAEAISKGIVMVYATNNASASGQLGIGTLQRTNGVVAVSAVDRAGDLQKKPDGSAYALPETLVVAAGIDLPSLGLPGGSWDDEAVTSGSSLAAPLVAGMLALAEQKYPQASGNQILQSMIRTTSGSVHEPTIDPSDGYGYGAAWPATLLEQDPTSLPDENPFMDRDGGEPTAELVASGGGAAAPTGFTPAPGDDSEASDGSSSSSGLAGMLIVVLAVVGVVVLAGAITVIIVIARNKSTRQGGTP